MPLRDHLLTQIHHIEQLEKRGDDAYGQQFQSVKNVTDSLRWQPQFCSRHGQLDCNRKKNRYKDILPYDSNRVTLEEIPGVPGSDYINASFIKGASGSNAYIAAQGPLSNTVDDFWQMIWEREIQVIVMACNEIESGRNKCERYWPEDDEVKEFADVRITLVSVKQLCPDFVIRTLKVIHQIPSTENGEETDEADKTAEERVVVQFHYLTWPDHGIPNSVSAILDMVRLIRECQGSETLPLLIHCSAGCGRTGTICAVDYVWGLLRSGKLNEDFCLRQLTEDLRRQRIAMVQTKDQYMLVHRAVRELFEHYLKVIDSHPYENLNFRGQPFHSQKNGEPDYVNLDEAWEALHASDPSSSQKPKSNGPPVKAKPQKWSVTKDVVRPCVECIGAAAVSCLHGENKETSNRESQISVEELTELVSSLDRLSGSQSRAVSQEIEAMVETTKEASRSLEEILVKQLAAEGPCDLVKEAVSSERASVVVESPPQEEIGLDLISGVHSDEQSPVSSNSSEFLSAGASPVGDSPRGKTNIDAAPNRSGRTFAAFLGASPEETSSPPGDDASLERKTSFAKLKSLFEKNNGVNKAKGSSTPSLNGQVVVTPTATPVMLRRASTRSQANGRAASEPRDGKPMKKRRGKVMNNLDLQEYREITERYQDVALHIFREIAESGSSNIAFRNSICEPAASSPVLPEKRATPTRQLPDIKSVYENGDEDTEETAKEEEQTTPIVVVPPTPQSPMLLRKKAANEGSPSPAPNNHRLSQSRWYDSESTPQLPSTLSPSPSRKFGFLRLSPGKTHPNSKSPSPKPPSSSSPSPERKVKRSVSLRFGFPSPFSRRRNSQSAVSPPGKIPGQVADYLAVEETNRQKSETVPARTFKSPVSEAEATLLGEVAIQPHVRSPRKDRDYVNVVEIVEMLSKEPPPPVPPHGGVKETAILGSDSDSPSVTRKKTKETPKMEASFSTDVDDLHCQEILRNCQEYLEELPNKQKSPATIPKSPENPQNLSSVSSSSPEHDLATLRSDSGGQGAASSSCEEEIARIMTSSSEMDSSLEKRIRGTKEAKNYEKVWLSSEGGKSSPPIYANLNAKKDPEVIYANVTVAPKMSDMDTVKDLHNILNELENHLDEAVAKCHAIDSKEVMKKKPLPTPRLMLQKDRTGSESSVEEEAKFRVRSGTYDKKDKEKKERMSNGEIDPKLVKNEVEYGIFVSGKGRVKVSPEVDEGDYVCLSEINPSVGKIQKEVVYGKINKRPGSENSDDSYAEPYTGSPSPPGNSVKSPSNTLERSHYGRIRKVSSSSTQTDGSESNTVGHTYGQIRKPQRKNRAEKVNAASQTDPAKKPRPGAVSMIPRPIVKKSPTAPPIPPHHPDSGFYKKGEGKKRRARDDSNINSKPTAPPRIRRNLTTVVRSPEHEERTVGVKMKAEEFRKARRKGTSPQENGRILGSPGQPTFECFDSEEEDEEEERPPIPEKTKDAYLPLSLAEEKPALEEDGEVMSPDSSVVPTTPTSSSIGRALGKLHSNWLNKLGLNGEKSNGPSVSPASPPNASIPVSKKLNENLTGLGFPNRPSDRPKGSRDSPSQWNKRNYQTHL